MEKDEGFFDFEERTEEGEKLDFTHLKPCPYCRKPIPSNALLCLYCGNTIYVYKRKKWLVLLIILVLLSFFFLILRS